MSLLFLFFSLCAVITLLFPFLQFHDAPPTLIDILSFMNLVFTFFFLLETIMKLIAFGCKVGSTAAIFCVLSFFFLSIDFWFLYVVVLSWFSWGGIEPSNRIRFANRERDPIPTTRVIFRFDNFQKLSPASSSCIFITFQFLFSFFIL